HRFCDGQSEAFRAMKGNIAVAGIEYREVVVARDVRIADHDVRLSSRGVEQFLLLCGMPLGIDGLDVQHDLGVIGKCLPECGDDGERVLTAKHTDRKSTRLNSSHLGISYA